MFFKILISVAMSLFPIALIAGDACDEFSGDEKQMCQAKKSGDGKFCTSVQSNAKQRECLVSVKNHQHMHLFTYKPMTEHVGNARRTKTQKVEEPVAVAKKGH